MIFSRMNVEGGPGGGREGEDGNKRTFFNLVKLYAVRELTSALVAAVS